MKHLILARTDAIGDLILTIPVARAIKEQHPEISLTMLVSRYVVPLIRKEPYLDQIITIPGRDLHEPGRVNAFSRDLRRLGADAILFFYPRPWLALAAWSARIEQRIGTGRRFYSLLFNRRVNLGRKNSGLHELELNYRLAEAVFPELTRFEPHLHEDHEAIEAARLLLEEVGTIGGRYIVVHPLSHGSAPNWRLNRYAALTRQLAQAGIECLVTGSELERDLIEAAFGTPDPRIHLVAGRTDLPTLVALIRGARLLVSGSTGPIHIASAVGTFAVGIYPPESALAATRWGPRGQANKLFAPPVHALKGDLQAAMEAIAVDEVARFIGRHLDADNVTKAS